MTDRTCVAVVEDDASLSQALERILRIKGYAPRTFKSAEALLRVKDHDDIRCLVLDIQLPGMSGFELYERLMQTGKILPVIFITAYDDTEARMQAEASKGLYLVKPFAGRVLLDAVGRMLTVPQATSSAN